MVEETRRRQQSTIIFLEKENTVSNTHSLCICEARLQSNAKRYKWWCIKHVFIIVIIRNCENFSMKA